MSGFCSSCKSRDFSRSETELLAVTEFIYKVSSSDLLKLIRLNLEAEKTTNWNLFMLTSLEPVWIRNWSRKQTGSQKL